jgi:hypothetical protein
VPSNIKTISIFNEGTTGLLSNGTGVVKIKVPHLYSLPRMDLIGLQSIS